MKYIAGLRDDALLSRVLRNGAHLFSSNSASLALSVLQSILAARLLGPSGFGLVGIVMSFASTLNGLLSFRMSEMVVRYGGTYLEQRDRERTQALIRLAGRAEALVSVGAFALTWLTAGLATRFFAKTQGTEWMFVVYGLGLLANFNAETSTGILQITDKIGVRGTVNFVQSVVSAAALVAVYLVNAQSGLASRTLLMAVLLSYLLGKTLLGIGLFVSARRELDRALGQDSGSRGSVTLPPLRELFGFAASSNLSATAILIFRESELLWIGLLLNSEAAGLYKIAYTIVSFLATPADPLILAVFPETNRLIVQRNWQRLRGFLRQVTTIAFAYNLLLSLGLALFGRLILSIFGSGYVPAYPALLALLVGLAFNYTLFWNRPVLLSFGLQVFALLAIAIAGLAKTILALALVPKYGFVMESLLLSGYYIVSVGLIVWRGMRELHAQESLDAAAIATK